MRATHKPERCFKSGDKVVRHAATFEVDGVPVEVDVTVNLTGLARAYARRLVEQKGPVRLAYGHVRAYRIVRSTRCATLPQGECKFCDEHRYDPMMPWHDASERCESGKHTHCTCDACF